MYAWVLIPGIEKRIKRIEKRMSVTDRCAFLHCDCAKKAQISCAFHASYALFFLSCNKLKGCYKIGNTLREKLNLDSNILTGSTKNWRNIKSVVHDYLDCAEVWEAQPQQFVSLLQTSLKTINRCLSKQPANSVQTNELLLKEYCSSLNTFYHHPQIIDDVKLYYQKMELKKRDEDNLQQVHIQSNATAAAIVFEKSRLMEVKSKKRSFDEIEDEDDCPVSDDAEEELTIDSISEINQQYEQSLFDTEDPFNINPAVSKVSSMLYT
ncbi:hypothetical protein K501DRAFT_275426 [Backusella circina FSU 941]|nr:hypothetical protein K501DRAFT_275426 [Backusella circina FSU 941]